MNALGQKLMFPAMGLGRRQCIHMYTHIHTYIHTYIHNNIIIIINHRTVHDNTIRLGEEYQSQVPYTDGQKLASTNSLDHLCDLRRWILTPLVDSDLKVHPETRHTISVMLAVIDGWSGCLRRICILMPFVEEDVKLQTEHSGGYRFWGGGGARMVGVAGGGVGFWPDTKSGGGGGGCCRFMARYEERGGGGGGAVGLWPDTRSGGGGGGVLSDSGPKRRAGGGGGGGGAVGFWPDTKGGGGGSMIAYRGARDIVQ